MSQKERIERYTGEMLAAMGRGFCWHCSGYGTVTQTNKQGATVKVKCWRCQGKGWLAREEKSE